MDGAHDMGGMHGFGPVPVGAEAVFHEPWERRVRALLGPVMGSTTIDRFRSTIEQMPPADYLASSYFERWLWALERLTEEQGLLEGAERPPAVVRPSASAPLGHTRFRPGDRVRVRNAVTPGHTRVPRYLRLHQGDVERVACAWPDPGESAATGIYGRPEPVYTVRFAGDDLFGPGADHVLLADLGERDLEAA
ncbi:MAG TPA: SH3-like domain-containing protein [Acidimicrobiales bacterium]|nr:SH3-like domain-containing protein [Acidimicrobiales bacterium]